MWPARAVSGECFEKVWMIFTCPGVTYDTPDTLRTCCWTNQLVLVALSENGNIFSEISQRNPLWWGVRREENEWRWLTWSPSLSSTQSVQVRDLQYWLFTCLTVPPGRCRGESPLLQLPCPPSSQVSSREATWLRASLLEIWRVREVCGELHTVDFLYDEDVQAPSEARWEEQWVTTWLHFWHIGQFREICCHYRARLCPAGVPVPGPGEGQVEDHHDHPGGDLHRRLCQGLRVGGAQSHRHRVLLLPPGQVQWRHQPGGGGGGGAHQIRLSGQFYRKSWPPGESY